MTDCLEAHEVLKGVALIRSTGYYQLTRARSRGQTMAHRHVWEECFGPIPDGLFVLHRCDNRPCVNPDHLFVGTQADNLRDMVEKGRSCRGERHWNAKLTEAEARVILATPRTPGSTRRLMRRFNISRWVINRIRARETWKNI